MEAPTGTPGARRMAVLIGVSDYQLGVSPDAVGWDPTALSDLQGPAEDVPAMFRVLEGQDGLGYDAENICVLLDSTATVAGVGAALSWLEAHATAGDEVLIYFSGHGVWVPDRSGDEIDQRDEALMLYDSVDALTGPVLLDDELGERLRALHTPKPGSIGAPRVTLIVDACFLGSITRGPSCRHTARRGCQSCRPRAAASRRGGGW
jgi:hypothetical protein